MRSTSLFFFFVAMVCITGCMKPSKSVSIAWDPSWYAISSDAPKDQLNGFFQDLLLELSKESGGQIVFQVHQRHFGDLKEGLGIGQYEMALYPLSPRPWDGHYSLSEPLLRTGVVLVVATDGFYRTLKDLKNQQLATLMDDETLNVLSDYPEISTRFYPSVATMLEDLKEGKVQAALVPRLSAMAYLEDLYTNELMIVSAPLTESAILWVSSQEHAPLIKNLEELMRRLKEKGLYDMLLQKWNLCEATR